jgi:hypothetical protein
MVVLNATRRGPTARAPHLGRICVVAEGGENPQPRSDRRCVVRQGGEGRLALWLWSETSSKASFERSATSGHRLSVNKKGSIILDSARRDMCDQFGPGHAHLVRKKMATTWIRNEAEKTTWTRFYKIICVRVLFT